MTKAWTESWPDEVPLPYIYPMPEGGVQLEWSSPLGSVTAEIALDSRQAEVLASRTSDGELIEEVHLNLGEASQWQALATLVLHQVKPGNRAT